MQVPQKYYDEIFDFKGQWDMPSRCGLKILLSGDTDFTKTVVIVTELYQDNPGTTVTAAGKSLMSQICQSKNLDPNDIVYVQCNPNTNSKLSFYDENFFEVTFSDSGEPVYKQVSDICLKELF
ncbi:MAG: hypothetical protein FWD26_01305 [Treponema sp.]|nr:hypothetical protein [Treponema sp.]